jgi:hypothetical protein
MAAAGAATLIQRFGCALNLNIHFHMLFLDGVYVDSAGSPLGIRKVVRLCCRLLLIVVFKCAINAQ